MIESIKAIFAFLIAIPCMALIVLYAGYAFVRTRLTGEKWNEGRGFYRDK